MLPKIILLGLLMNGPKHGYQISLYIKEIMSRLARLTSGSIYYHLKMLEKEGLVERTTSKAGNRPERQIYTITEAGINEFKRMAEANLFISHRPVWAFNCSIFFLRHLDGAKARQALERRINRLERELAEVRGMKIVAQELGLAFHLISLIDHGLVHLAAEVKWMQELLGQLKSTRIIKLPAGDFEQFLERFYRLMKEGNI